VSVQILLVSLACPTFYERMIVVDEIDRVCSFGPHEFLSLI
jgi:hypothetical protein